MKARDNPLAVRHLHELRYRFLEGSWFTFHAQRKALHNRGAIVGPKGSGKTTLLAELETHLVEEGWRVHSLRLSRAHSAPEQAACLQVDAELDGRDFLLLDGTEQLSALAWRRFMRDTDAAGGLIITAHHRGRLPLLHRAATTPELLAELLAELVPEETFRVEDCYARYRRHAGNIREALFELYDEYAGA